MTWSVYGDEVRFRLVGDSLSVSGGGSQELRIHHPIRHGDRPLLERVQAARAQWSLSRAGGPSEMLALLESLTNDPMTNVPQHRGGAKPRVRAEVELSKTTRDMAIVSWLVPPTGSRHAEEIGFAFYLPDRQFEQAVMLLQMVATGPKMHYRFSVDAHGFLPSATETDHPALAEIEPIITKEWFAGRELVTSGFTLSVIPVAG